MSPRRQLELPRSERHVPTGRSILVSSAVLKATVEAEVFPRLTDRRLEIYESL